MAKVSQITVSLGKTISKDYNSTRYDYSVTVDVDDGEDAVKIAAEYTDWCKDRIRIAIKPEPRQDQPSTWPAVGQ